MNVILVPRNKCLLDVLAEMEERIENAWLFINDDVVMKLEEDCLLIECMINEEIFMYWQATENNSRTSLSLKTAYGEWFFCSSISAEDISFTVPAPVPNDVFFIMMED